MELEIIIEELEDLKKFLGKGNYLNFYCEQKNISHTSTSRILKRGVKTMQLRTAYNILGLTPERNISQGVLSTKIQDLLEVKEAFLEGVL